MVIVGLGPARSANAQPSPGDDGFRELAIRLLSTPGSSTSVEQVAVQLLTGHVPADLTVALPEIAGARIIGTSEQTLPERAVQQVVLDVRGSDRDALSSIGEALFADG